MSASAMLAALPPGLVWQADRLARSAAAGLPSGFAALDAELPGGGWPRGALIELLADSPGIGELALLLPVMRALPGERWLAWVGPPHRPYAPALAAAGVPLARLLLLEPADHAERLWTIRQTVASGGCELVLAWLARADPAALRRLQLAAEESATPLFLFRPTAAALQSSPASLRLRLAARDDTLVVDILKRRGPALAAPLRLAVPDRPVVARPPGDAATRPTAPLHPSPISRASDAVVRADPARPAAAGLHARRG